MIIHVDPNLQPDKFLLKKFSLFFAVFEKKKTFLKALHLFYETFIEFCSFSWQSGFASRVNFFLNKTSNDNNL